MAALVLVVAWSASCLIGGCGGESSGPSGAPDNLQAGPTPVPGRIAFCQRSGGLDTDFVLKVVNSDGTGLKKLVDTNYNPMWPTWSPDGKRIAFQGQTSQFPGSSIYVLTLATKKITRVSDGMYPNWSHDGHSILVTREDNTSTRHLWRMTPAGTSLIQLTDGAEGDYDGCWTSGDNRIVYASNRDWYVNYLYSEIFTQRTVQGAQVRRMTQHPGNDEMPVASPTTDQVVYCSSLDFNWELVLTDWTAENSAGIRLTQNTADDVDPAWSPDGTQIVFASDRQRADRFELYVTKATGGRATHLTNTQTSHRFPAWGPPAQ
jgi:Tol biopolymer transport system component